MNAVLTDTSCFVVDYQKSRQISEAPPEEGEEGEEMDVTNDGDGDAAMMAMMGLSGFGSTKVRPSSYIFVAQL